MSAGGSSPLIDILQNRVSSRAFAIARSQSHQRQMPIPQSHEDDAARSDAVIASKYRLGLALSDDERERMAILDWAKQRRKEDGNRVPRLS